MWGGEDLVWIFPHCKDCFDRKQAEVAQTFGVIDGFNIRDSSVRDSWFTFFFLVHMRFTNSFVLFVLFCLGEQWKPMEQCEKCRIWTRHEFLREYPRHYGSRQLCPYCLLD